jgi:hypothetical protein
MIIRALKKDEKFNFPVYFDDKDFDALDYKPKEEQPGLKFTEEGKQKASDVYLDDKYSLLFLLGGLICLFFIKQIKYNRKISYFKKYIKVNNLF